MNVEFELVAIQNSQSESVVPRFTVPRPARHRHPRLVRRPPRARAPLERAAARALPAFAVVPASRVPAFAALPV